MLIEHYAMECELCNIGTNFDLELYWPLVIFIWHWPHGYTLPLACPELVDEQEGTHSQVTTSSKPVQGNKNKVSIYGCHTCKGVNITHVSCIK